jgi:RHS repeat-associated protein
MKRCKRHARGGGRSLQRMPTMATQTQTGRVFNRPATEAFTHDADGNLTQDGRWTYVWDGENRLIEMKRDTDTPAGARQRLVFEYDHQGRRIRKQFYTHNGSNWVLSSDTAFAYDGWNLVGELNAASSNARLRTYLWGLDLSGTEQGAGGVGGLWLVIDYTSGTTYHWPAYDGNGNVAALVAQANGSLSARYEYGPFGEPIRATGPMARKNPFRFSTKFTDNETGLIYYGYRFYDPVTGRWLNRDPIGERGGINTMAFPLNSPIDVVDLHGLGEIPPPAGGPETAIPWDPGNPTHEYRPIWPAPAPRMGSGLWRGRDGRVMRPVVPEGTTGGAAPAPRMPVCAPPRQPPRGAPTNPGAATGGAGDLIIRNFAGRSAKDLLAAIAEGRAMCQCISPRSLEGVLGAPSSCGKCCIITLRGIPLSFDPRVDHWELVSAYIHKLSCDRARSSEPGGIVALKHRRQTVHTVYENW